MYKPAHVARWEARRWLALFTAIAAAMAMTLVFAGKAQADHVNSWPHDAGPGVNPNSNHEDYWEAWAAAGKHGHAAETDWVCVKLPGSSENSDFEFEQLPPAGHSWRLLIIKAGAEDDANTLYWDPIAGDGEFYPHAEKEGYSHVIACSRPLPVTTSSGDTGSSDTQATTPTTPTTDSTAPTSTDTKPTTPSTDSTPAVLETTLATDAPTTAPSTAGPTISGVVVTTAPSSTVEDLPLTGMDTGTLLGLGAALMGLGLALLAMTRRPRED